MQLILRRRCGDRAAKLDAMLAVNRNDDGPALRPDRVTAGEEVWRNVPELEFYVDFETVSDLNDDFFNLPNKGWSAPHLYDRVWTPRARFVGV